MSLWWVVYEFSRILRWQRFLAGLSGWRLLNIRSLVSGLACFTVYWNYHSVTDFEHCFRRRAERMLY
jgi:hypothetical protein